MEWLALISTLIAWAFGIVAFLALIGYGYQVVANERQQRIPPGEMLSIADRKMHLYGLGEQCGPTVVLETGGSNSSITSRKIQTEMAKFARVVAYDRAGFGYSDPVSRPRTFDEITADLDQLLTQAGVSPPFILVGESMGGLMVRNYYRHHPDKVAGIVLLDAAEEEHSFRRLEKLRSMQGAARISAWLARFGLVRLFLALAGEKVGIPADASPERKAEIVAEYSRPEFFEAAGYELEAYFSTSQNRRVAGGFGLLGATPLVVVQHGNPLTGSQAFLEDGWSEAQARLAELSTNSSLRVAEDSGHAISLDRPDLVVEVVRGLIEKTGKSD